MRTRFHVDIIYSVKQTPVSPLGTISKDRNTHFHDKPTSARTKYVHVLFTGTRTFGSRNSVICVYNRYIVNIAF